MKSLQSVSGLPINLDEDNKLHFLQPLKKIEPKIRTVDDLKPVLMDKNAQADFKDAYYMYRNVHFADHDSIIKEAGVTYDITVIPAGKIGNEYNKTLGHYHALKEGTPFAYPEVYEVIAGKALFLLQKMDPEYKNVITIIAMEAREGQKVVYPPNYGHIIVNIGDETLVTSNWVGDKFERVYDPVKDKSGLAYYVVQDGHGYKFEPNPNYTEHPQVRMLTDKFMHRFQIMSKGPMYEIGISNPKALEFLNKPDDYAVELSSITS